MSNENNFTHHQQQLLPPYYTPAAFEYVDTDERMVLYGGVFAGCCILFVACLVITHKFFSSPTNTCCSPYVHQIYINLPLREQADWCSRVNSTIHAAIVCIAFPWTLAQTRWSQYPYLLPEDDMAVRIRCIMALAAAYFTVDTFVIVYFRVPLYGVFLAHHVAAAIPFFNNIFSRDPDCRRATFDLGLFLLVEFCSFFVNTQSWMETCKVKTVYKRLYVAMNYGVFLSWIPLRLVLPVFLMVHLYRTIVLPTDVMKGCMYAPLASAHFICLFCFVVFFGLFLPQMWTRWFGKGPLPEDQEEAEEGEAREKIEKAGEERKKIEGTTDAGTTVQVPVGLHEPLAGEEGEVVHPPQEITRSASFREILEEGLLVVAHSGHV